MATVNVTEFIGADVYQLPLSTYNSSHFLGDEYDNINSLIEVTEDENATQLILTNGTKTKVPKFIYSSGRSKIAPIIVKLSFYTCPVMVAVGLLSNLLAYLVFTRTRLRKVPSVPYLAAMAVVDTGALVTEFIQRGLVLHGINVISWSGVCQYTTYFNYVFIFLSTWYPVALCVEKFISVYFPLRKTALCTTFRAKVVVISMAVMTGTCYHYTIYMTGPVGRGKICYVWEVFFKDFYYLMKLDSVFVILLPKLVLIALMILICARGCEYYRISSAVEVPHRTGSTRNSSIQAPVRVTNVIFPVVFVVLTLKLPLGLIRVYYFMAGTFMSNVVIELQSIFMFVSRFEWIIKLYIYLAFSPSFRRRTKSFLCGIRASLKHRCHRESFEDEEMEGIAVAARINLPERRDRENNHRACLMVSDV